MATKLEKERAKTEKQRQKQILREKRRQLIIKQEADTIATRRRDAEIRALKFEKLKKDLKTLLTRKDSRFEK